MVVLLFRAQIHEAEDMGVDPAAADLVSARLREISTAEAGQKRSDNHHRTTELGAFSDKVPACNIFSINLIRLKSILSLLMAGDLDAHPFKQKDKIPYIQNLRNVFNGHRLPGQKNRTDNLQGFILRPLRPYRATQFVAAFYYERTHSYYL